MRTVRRPAPAILSAAGLLVAGPALADVTFSDTEFAPATWTHEIVYDDEDNLAFSVQYESGGGNPDAHLRVFYGTPVGDGFPDPLDVAVGHFLVGATVDPVIGAIELMDFSIDVEVLEGGVSGAVGVNLMLRQSGIVYFGPTFAALDLGGGTWVSADHPSLPEIAFRDIETLQTPPDFSPAGAPIELGFVTHAATSTLSPIEQDARLDNFSVTVHQTAGTSAGLAPAVGASPLRAWPNPFTSATTLRYQSPRDAAVCVAVFDVTGRRVRTLLDRHQSGGPHEITWNGTDDTGRALPTAPYFIKLHTAGSSETLPVLRIR